MDNKYTLIDNSELVQKIHSLLNYDTSYTRFDSIKITIFFWKKTEDPRWKLLFACFNRDGIQQVTIQCACFKEDNDLDTVKFVKTEDLDTVRFGDLIDLDISFPDDINDVTLADIERQANFQLR